MTRQEAFNSAYLGVIAQGGPAADLNGQSCLYRKVMKDGSVRKCNFGHLIPDDLYSKEFESQKASMIMHKLPKTIHFDCSDEFMNSLQRCHDYSTRDTISDSEFLDAYRRRMRYFAVEYGLTVPEDV